LSNRVPRIIEIKFSGFLRWSAVSIKQKTIDKLGGPSIFSVLLARASFQ
jgi:hypothetical protein